LAGTPRRIPRCTYRLQLGPQFRFSDVEGLLDYLHQLGVSDLYLSPILQSAAASGYDVVAHERIHPELGTEEELSRLAGRARTLGMGILLDIVPNHMGIADSANHWWMDILENGPASLYAGHFDIDWRPVRGELADRVLLPVLGDQYGTVLENGDFRLAYESGAFVLNYHDWRLPTAPATWIPLLQSVIDSVRPSLGEDHPDLHELQSIVTALGYLPPRQALPADKLEERNREKEVIKRRLGQLLERNTDLERTITERVAEINGVPGEPASFDELDALIAGQSYRPAFWKVATEEINYRRFFDVNSLAAIKVEEPAVFEATHRLVLRLVREGVITGLRVDHPDGLWDPVSYFAQLQAAATSEGESPRAGSLAAEIPVTDTPPAPKPGGETLVADTPPAPKPGGETLVADTPPAPKPGGETLVADTPPAPKPGGETFSAETPLAPVPGGEAHAAGTPPAPVPVSVMTLTETPGCPPPGEPADCLYVVAEKILSPGEDLPTDWAVAGTTGYDFLNDVAGLFIDAAHEKTFARLYAGLTDVEDGYRDLVCACKKQIMQESMSGEINSLALQLLGIASRNRHYRDFTMNSLVFALREVISCMGVYRTYIRDAQGPQPGDRQEIELAVARARTRVRRAAREVVDFLRDVLLLANLHEFAEAERPEVVRFVLRFQQVTGPVMAKGAEDTAFYVYNRLLALNEVGGDPDRFGRPVDVFHRGNQTRLRCWPHTLLATATHDTKRGEDHRARLTVLSEMPGEWRATVTRWRRLNAAGRRVVDDERAPDRNDEYFLYQTLVGTWPVAESEAGLDGRPPAEYIERLSSYLRKAVKEAKVHSSWINPNEAYDAAVAHFIEWSLSGEGRGRFREEVSAFSRRIAHFGRINALSQTLLKLTCPGVPDIYQGTEFWDLSMVDPDNRRPVDFEARRAALDGLTRHSSDGGPVLPEDRASGDAKLYTIRRALEVRRRCPEVFSEGSYEPVEVKGARAAHVVAFLRRRPGQAILVVVPRLVLGLTGGVEVDPVGEEIWGDTRLLLPDLGGVWQDRFTGGRPAADDGVDGGLLPMRLADVLSTWPVALLELIGRTGVESPLPGHVS